MKEEDRKIVLNIKIDVGMTRDVAQEGNLFVKNHQVYLCFSSEILSYSHFLIPAVWWWNLFMHLLNVVLLPAE